MLTLNDISRRAGAAALLTDVSFSVEPGELVSVLGATGSGKTSLLRVIMGLDAPQAGQLRWGPRLLADGGVNCVPAQERGFSMVFQQTLLLPFLDLDRNIMLGIPHPRAEDRERLAGVLQLLCLEPLSGRSVERLSGGEQQRVALARALVLRPRLLLLDEPFTSLDLPLKERLLPRIKEYLAAEGTTALLVTHDRYEAFFFGQRLLLLDEGRLLQQGQPDRLYHAPRDARAAGLLGACNLVSTEAAAGLWGVSAAGQGGEATLLVRPEQLLLDPEPPHNGVLRRCIFQGAYQTLLFQVEQGPLLEVKALVNEEFEVERGYRVLLTNSASLTPLMPLE